MPNMNDDLYIRIDAESKKAEKALDSLIGKLGTISTALNHLNTGNISAFASSMGQVGNAANNIDGKKVANNIDRISKSTSRASKNTLSLAAAFGKFYASYFLVIRGAKALWKSIESTADYIETYNYYNVAFGKIASEWESDFAKYGYENAESYAESFTDRTEQMFKKMSGVSVGENGIIASTGLKNLGLNLQEITQYAAQLASITNSLGQTGETSLAISKSMTMLAGDISSLFNLDYSEVAKNLQSGLIGQSRALYRYGIDITNATLQTYAYELGLSKAVSEMTQAEKQQLRLLAILDQSKVSWGDLANTINSPNNQLRILKNNLQEAGFVLGQLFIPLLEKALPVVNGLVVAFKRLAESVANYFGISIDYDKFGQGYNEMEEDVDDLADAYENAAQAANEWKNQLLGFDKVTKLNEQSASGVSKGELLDTIDLTKEIIEATSEYEKVWNEAFDKMEAKAEKFADRIQKYLEPVTSIFKNLFDGDFKAAGEDINNLAQSILGFFEESIERIDGKKIGGAIGDLLGSIEWGELLIDIFRIKFDIWGLLIEAWTASFDAAPFETLIITSFALLNWGRIGQSIATFMGLGFAGSGATGGTGSTGGTGGGLGILAPLLGLGAAGGAASGSGTLGTVTATGLGTALGSFFKGIKSAAIAAIVAAGGYALGNNLYEGITKQDFDMSIGEVLGELGDVNTHLDAVEPIKDYFGSFIKESDDSDLGTTHIHQVEKPHIRRPENTQGAIDIGPLDLSFSLSESTLHKTAIELSKIEETAKNVLTEAGRNSSKAYENGFSISESVIRGKLTTPITSAVNNAKPTASSGGGVLADNLENGFALSSTILKGKITNPITTAINDVKKSTSTSGSSLFTSLKNIGSNIISGINAGLSATPLVQGVKSAATTIVGAFKDALGIHSPSRVFEGLAGYTIEGFNLGIAKNAASSQRAMSAWANGLSGYTVNTAIPTINTNYSVPKTPSYSGSGFADSIASAIVGDGNKDVNVTVVLQGDADRLFTVVQNKANNYTAQTGKPAFN